MASILAITNSYDDCHIEAVEKHVLAAGHDFLRIDIDRIIRGECQVTWNYKDSTVYFSNTERIFDLRKFDSVWYRKPFGYGLNIGFAECISDPVQRNVVEKEFRD